MIKGKPIYVCRHHEMVFYYWCKAKKEMNIDTFFLVTIDRHKDLSGLPLDMKREINRLDLKELDKVRELAIRPRAQNLWARSKLAYNQFYAAMEAGLIRDILIISPEVPCEEVYQDLSGQKHRIFHCGHPNNLRDLLMRDRVLKESMDYPEGKLNIALDIDLDFFTYLDDKGEPLVISEENFKNIFCSDSLIWWIYEKARFVTISKEPFWCGGNDNSEHIFQLLKTYFLNRISD